LGPDYRFVKYQADAHHIHLEDLDVFSDGGPDSVGLSFQLDVDFTYFLKEEEIGVLHRDLAKTYTSVIQSRTIDAIKNSATTVPFTDYFKKRKDLEAQLKEAIQARWNEKPQLHAELDQFFLGRILIPSFVADKQLSAKIQIETNKKEEYLQQTRIEREVTAVQVNTINLEKNKLLRETEAKASLITENAIADAERINNDAINEGTADLLQAVGIGTQEYSTAYTYIRTLQNRRSLNLSVSYLDQDNVLKTTSAAAA